jgi:hypothetical protein
MMRLKVSGWTAAGIVAAGLAVTGCGPSEEQKRAEADARAASFTPPSVTSRLDFGSAMTRRFRALDRNADEYIDETELPSRSSRLRRLDRNKDGRISAIEFSEGMLGWFDRVDANHDGTITSDEREAARSDPDASAALDKTEEYKRPE